MDIEKTPFEEMDELLIKYLSGSASSKEREEALEWIKQSRKNKLHFDQLKDYYQLTKVIQKPSGFDKEKGWERVKADYYKARFNQKEEITGSHKIKSMIRIVASIAASVIIAFFTGIYVNKYFKLKLPTPTLASNTIEVPFGSKSQITLPDGTKVWLNAGSKLTYSGNFAKENREVSMEGEAFFDVAKSKEHQFVVKTSNINIKVYGTKFNVKSYPDENKIFTTLVEGALAIQAHGKKIKEKEIFLEPNQTATYFKETATIDKFSDRKFSNKNLVKSQPQKMEVIKKINTEKVTSWKENKWIFEAEELEKMAVILERRYNVEIFFENESLKKYRFSGTLLEETFEQVLKVIQLSAPIEYTIKKNHVWLKEDKNYKEKYDEMIRN